MFGLRSSIAVASDVGRRVLQSVSFHGLRAQCVHIRAGMEIPDNKPLQFALQYIHGVGRARARQVLAELNMTNKLARDLTRREVFVLGNELDKYILGRELEVLVYRDIQKMQAMRCYKGIRHTDKLPCRGQRTHTNARTRKGRSRIAIAAAAKLKKK